MLRDTRAVLLSLLLILLSSSFAICASVNVIPSGGGIFSVLGSAMDGVAGIELTITYDAASLGSPAVTQGGLVSGAMLAANTTIPGSIRIAIISTKPFSGSGQIASISFARQTGSGGITSVKSNIIDSSGAPVSSQSDIGGGSPSSGSGLSATAGVPFSQPTATSTLQTTAQPSSQTSAQAAGSMPAYLGTVTMLSDVPIKNETKAADAGVPVKFTEPAAAKAVEQPAEEKTVLEPQKAGKAKMISYKGALEIFRTYRGEKSPAILISLLNQEISPTILQKPAVALSDGKTPLVIIVKLEVAGDKSPNFALNGAKLLSLNKDASSSWIIEALPRANVVQASLTILTDSDTIEYPLTLSPPIESVSSLESDFALFLKDGGAATPKRDLNGDGRHDYLDDYIYSVNYLVKKLHYTWNI
jgi:hypothetical protein